MKVLSTFSFILFFGALFAQKNIDVNKVIKKIKIEPSINRGTYVLDSTVTFISLTPGNPQLFTKSAFQYDNVGKETKAYNSSVDIFSGGSTLELSSIDSSVYDAKGNLSVKFTKLVDVNGVVSNYTKVSSTYDSNNSKLTEKTQKWNTTTNQYDDLQLLSYLYNAKNKEIRYLKQTYSGSSLINDSKDTSIYDSSDRLVENISLIWDETTSSWVNESRTVNMYVGTATNVSTNDGYDWINNAWVLTNKGANTYNSDNKISLYNYYELDTTVNQFVNTYRYVYTYDSNKNLKTVVASASDNGSNFSEIVRINYYWSELKTGIKGLYDSQIKVIVPNPIVSNQLISCSNLKAGSQYKANIIDLNGQIKQSFNFSGDFYFPTNLSNGYYLIQITEDNLPVRLFQVVKN